MRDTIEKFIIDATYRAIGQRCVFCHELIKAGEPTHSAKDKDAHTDCLMYVVTKYPTFSLTVLEGNIPRQNVEWWTKSESPVPGLTIGLREKHV